MASEAFADRAYEATGALRSRSLPGAVIGDPAAAVARVLQMLRQGAVTAVTGERVALQADTICIHGDTPGAVSLAAAVRDGLEAAGVAVVPFGVPPGSTASGSCTARSG